MTGLTVVKLGGSHAFSAHLRQWIDAIEAQAGRIVVVPGGGVFADQVREAQPRMGFDDSAAHVMAMLAMAQYGHALASLARKLDVVDSLAALRRCLAQARAPVWSPTPMALQDSAIAHSWDVTSDSLALWLARELNAERLLLIKQRLPIPSRRTARQLSEDGIVDAAFAGIDAVLPDGSWIAGPHDHEHLSAFCMGVVSGVIRIEEPQFADG